MKTKGHSEKVDSEGPTISGQVWHLPHFSMQQAKFRAVYDDSAEFHRRSMNQETFTGPVLLEPLLQGKTWFRLGQYAVIADPKECFV